MVRLNKPMSEISFFTRSALTLKHSKRHLKDKQAITIGKKALTMDFDQIVSGHKSRTCIMSVEQYEDGSYGNILIVASNKAHREDAEQVFHRTFVPNSPYYYYLPQDKNFEDFIYRCACLGQPLHTYVPVEQMGIWVNIFLLPLESDKKNIGYCLYSCDISSYADSEQQASLAADTATKALEISIKLGGATKDNTLQIFEELIEDIRQLCKADICGIMLSNFEGKRYAGFCEARSDESTLRQVDIYNDIGFLDVADTFDATIGGSSCVIVKDENDMKWLGSKNPAWYSMLLEYDIKSIILFPLKHNGQTLGYLWALNFNTEDTVRIKEILELSTLFIASEVANYELMKQLEYLSSIDVLTGCKNRNAMNNAVNDIISGKMKIPEPYAVFFADLNGLKRINDEKGHSAGDRLLRTAAAILGEVFYESDVYRAGGDEFMLIASGLSEDEVSERLVQLKEKSAINSDVHFAVGSYIVGNGEDIRKAMRIADERMYIDKKNYYEEHPERKYR